MVEAGCPGGATNIVPGMLLDTTERFVIIWA